MRQRFHAIPIAIILSAVFACAQDKPPPSITAGTIRGHVLDDATSKPIPGATVHYSNHENRPGQSPFSGDVLSGADGSYTLPDLPPDDPVLVRVTASGYFATDFVDGPSVEHDSLPTSFSPRSTHDLRLKESHNLIAIGSSVLRPDMSAGAVTMASFSPDAQFITLSMGPDVALISLPSGDVRKIPLPKELASHSAPISGLGWDGKKMLFAVGEDTKLAVAAASAPDFRVVTLPTAKTQVEMVIQSANFVRYHVGRNDDCDDAKQGQSCGLIVYDKQKKRLVPIKQGFAPDLSYVLNEPLGMLAYTEYEEKQILQKTSKHSVKTVTMRTLPAAERVTLLNLDTGIRSHVTLPTEPDNAWRTITLLDGKPVGEEFRVAYSVRGDCDRNTTMVAVPATPVIASNDWSVCVITIPMPPTPAVTQIATTKRSRGK